MKDINLIELFNIVYHEKSGDYWTVTVGGIMAFVGLVFVIFSIIDAIKYSKKTQAKVLKSEPTYKTKRGIEEVYINTYSYDVGDINYKVEIKESKEYEKDDVNIVFYNKKDPSIVKRSSGKKTIIIGLCAIVLGLLVMSRGFVLAASLAK